MTRLALCGPGFVIAIPSFIIIVSCALALVVSFMPMAVDGEVAMKEKILKFEVV